MINNTPLNEVNLSKYSLRLQKLTNKCFAAVVLHVGQANRRHLKQFDIKQKC